MILKILLRADALILLHKNWRVSQIYWQSENWWFCINILRWIIKIMSLWKPFAPDYFVTETGQPPARDTHRKKPHLNFENSMNHVKSLITIQNAIVFHSFVNNPGYANWTALKISLSVIRRVWRDEIFCKFQNMCPSLMSS